MTTTPNEPVRDEDIETTGLGATTAPGSTDQGGGDADSGDADGSDGSRDGAEGGPLDTADESDADAGDA